jgi:hypothetical protein
MDPIMCAFVLISGLSVLPFTFILLLKEENDNAKDLEMI